jgi:hypothetical protein
LSHFKWLQNLLCSNFVKIAPVVYEESGQTDTVVISNCSELELCCNACIIMINSENLWPWWLNDVIMSVLRTYILESVLRTYILISQNLYFKHILCIRHLFQIVWSLKTITISKIRVLYQKLWSVNCKWCCHTCMIMISFENLQYDHITIFYPQIPT